MHLLDLILQQCLLGLAPIDVLCPFNFAKRYSDVSNESGEVLDTSISVRPTSGCGGNYRSDARLEAKEAIALIAKVLDHLTKFLLRDFRSQLDCDLMLLIKLLIYTQKQKSYQGRDNQEGMIVW